MDLTEWTIARIAPRIRKREWSPVELTREMLDRVERLQPRLNAFISVTADLALAQARQAEKEIGRGRYRGPLHGIPITLKDIFYTRGIRTTAGSKILRGFAPKENAAVVDRLFAAGAVLLGKTNLHEFAFGATNVNPHFGPTRNPWDLDRVTGGSSGGSAAAVATVLGLASLGSDTGGSIRLPASACGIVGLKPTLGRVPLHGVVPLSFSLDHIGPMCRSVEDAALVLGVIAGHDARDPGSRGAHGENFGRALSSGLKGLRIGIPRQYFFERLQKDVRSAVQEAIEHMRKRGARLRDVSIPQTRDTADLAALITVVEAISFHSKWLEARPGDYGEDLRTRMLGALNLSARAYLAAQEKRKRYTAAFEQALANVDLLATPTLPVVAPRLDETEVSVGRGRENIRLALLRFTRPANLTGLPAISVPCGFSSERLPVGLQLTARRYDEATLLRAAYGFEQSTEWHRMIPKIAG